jgi:tetratricopeptide (TPR) repeat protein
MLSEDGLLLVVVFVACALVALGTLELVWPTRPRHAQRRPAAARDPWRRARSRTVPPARFPHGAPGPAPEASLEAPGPRAVSDVPTESPGLVAAAPALLASDGIPAAPPAVVEAASRATGDGPPTPVPGVVSSVTPPAEQAPRERSRPARTAVSPPPVAPIADAPPPITPPPATPRGAEPEGSVVERASALLTRGRFAEVLALGEEGLKATRSDGMWAPTAGAARETARLWGLVGLAKQELDDVEGARFAFEEAIALAPRSERTTWERHLAALALTVGRRPLGDVATEPGTARVVSLRSAIDWLDRGLAVSPGDAELRDTLTAAREALWRAHGAVLEGLLQRREFAEARRILGEALADPECPPGWQRQFRRLLGRAMSGEARHATAEALSCTRGGRGDEAMAALLRAQSLIEAIDADALGARRRRELERRLWSGYVKLGVDRVEAGAQDAGLAALFRALSLSEAGSERGRQVRGVLARALGEIVDARAADIDRLIDAGDTGGALRQSEKLWSLLRGAVDRGLPQDDLADASGRVLALFDRMCAKHP